MENRNDGYSASEIRLDQSGDMDWSKAMAEFGDEAEGPEPAAAPPEIPAEEASVHEPVDATPSSDELRAIKQALPPVKPAADRQLSKYEQLCKTPSISMCREDITVMGELSDMLAKISEGLHALEKFAEAHPSALRPRILATCTDNLKDTAGVMFKEFHALRNGRLQKTYDKRCVCQKCHQVFMVSLPEDGICDECRAAAVPRSSPY